MTDLEDQPVANAGYAECPAVLCQARNYSAWEKSLTKYLRLERPLTLYKSVALKLVSTPHETAEDFRIRLQQLANATRDDKVAVLRGRYATRLSGLEQSLQRAQQALRREEEQASGSKMDTAASIGAAVLDVIVGRKRASVSSISRAGAAVRKAGNMRKQIGDVERAADTIVSVQQKIKALSDELDAEVAAIQDACAAQVDELQEVVIRANSSNIRLDFLGIGWKPGIVKM